MNSGISFHNKFYGMQIGFENGYGCTIVPDSISDDERFDYSTVSIVIIRENNDGSITNMTIPIMERMGYKPDEEETFNKMFKRIKPSKLLEILYFVFLAEKVFH
jgi:hypothetical protein